MRIILILLHYRRFCLDKKLYLELKRIGSYIEKRRKAGASESTSGEFPMSVEDPTLNTMILNLKQTD
jgi:hypothetical protein